MIVPCFTRHRTVKLITILGQICPTLKLVEPIIHPTYFDFIGNNNGEFQACNIKTDLCKCYCIVFESNLNQKYFYYASDTLTELDAHNLYLEWTRHNQSIIASPPSIRHRTTAKQDATLAMKDSEDVNKQLEAIMAKGRKHLRGAKK